MFLESIDVGKDAEISCSSKLFPRASVNVNIKLEYNLLFKLIFPL